MNMLVRVLVGFGGISSVLMGLFFLGGGQMFEGAFASEGVDIGFSIFSTIAIAALLVGALGCWGAFGDNKLAACIFCVLSLPGWYVGTIYGVICLGLIFMSKQQTAEQDATAA